LTILVHGFWGIISPHHEEKTQAQNNYSLSLVQLAVLLRGRSASLALATHEPGRIATAD
jgi:hypothetical protein